MYPLNRAMSGGAPCGPGKGNSLFSEVEDRRHLVERQMAKMRARHDALAARFEAQRAQLRKVGKGMYVGFSLHSFLAIEIPVQNYWLLVNSIAFSFKGQDGQPLPARAVGVQGRQGSGLKLFIFSLNFWRETHIQYMGGPI